MIPDVVVADGKLHSEMEIRHGDRLAIERSEHNAKRIIGAPDLHPHPFDFAGGIAKLRLDVVAGFEHSLCSTLNLIIALVRVRSAYYRLGARPAPVNRSTLNGLISSSRQPGAHSPGP